MTGLFVLFFFWGGGIFTSVLVIVFFTFLVVVHWTELAIWIDFYCIDFLVYHELLFYVQIFSCIISYHIVLYGTRHRGILEDTKRRPDAVVTRKI